jgi:hypothetical protein
MRIVPQPHGQVASGLGFSASQRAFEIDKLASRCRPKTMHAAPLNAQRITILADVALQTILPAPASAREVCEKIDGLSASSACIPIGSMMLDRLARGRLMGCEEELVDMTEAW